MFSRKLIYEIGLIDTFDFDNTFDLYVTNTLCNYALLHYVIAEFCRSDVSLLLRH